MAIKETISPESHIIIHGARMHNLKNIDLTIPRKKLVVITGLSGSGKSSLAFDTLFAEGQRRYLESLSAYARQFIGNLSRPDVDKIEGLSPVVAIEQKTVSKNPRSTVGTITEIYDFLRLLFARAGIAYSYKTGKPMEKFSEDQIIDTILTKFGLKNYIILAPLVKSRKGHYRDLFEQMARKGYRRVRIDGEVVEIKKGLQLDRYTIHDIELVVDTIEAADSSDRRVKNSIKTALKVGEGSLYIIDKQNDTISFYSKALMDSETGLSYEEPQPNMFSFNSPYGACKHCHGIGTASKVDVKNIIPDDNLNIIKGGIVPLGQYRENYTFAQLRGLAKHLGFNLATPIKNLDSKALDALLNGYDKEFEYIYVDIQGKKHKYYTIFKGVIPMVHEQYFSGGDEKLRTWAEEFMETIACPQCNGGRLKKSSLYFKINDKNIAQLSQMNITELASWFKGIDKKLTKKQLTIATEVLKEINKRIGFLVDIGLGYLSLNSPSGILSGGEAQRIRLATQIGTQLVNVLYILDEPSIGLHPRDNMKLIQSLKNLRDLGNSVIVVEHDEEMMQEADYIIDFGPKAGINGGEIVAAGTYAEILKSNSDTAQYLSGKKEISIPKKRRKGNGKKIVIKGCRGNNLKEIDVSFPLGCFVGVSGVSGSGKSSLINQTLYPAVATVINRHKKRALPYKSIKGIENIDKVVRIDQSPIGRTPRSNPATYVGVFTEIRKLFGNLAESKVRGYKIGRFSFNVKGGRCEECRGAGVKTIEMNFLPNVEVPCDGCQGKRYNRETLEVRYKGKSINDVLNMSIDTAMEFFKSIPNIYRKISTMQQVGLGYICLGQSSTTLSGGEAQRVKLSSELSKRDTSQTLYILDEPTTGLHFEDVKMLLEVLHELVNRGNTVIVIEHNLDVLKVTDYIIDIGDEGGNAGGNLVATGTPEQIAKINKGYTAKFLAESIK